MANEWQSQLPSAWKPQNPNEQVNAAKTGAETIAATAQAGQTAVAAEAANQERIRKQALQDIMAQSIDTKIGPDGRARHEFNNDKFLGLLKTNPAAADAYDVWHTKINPANATAATQRAMAGATTAEGGLSAADLAKSAQGSEYAGQILAAGRGIQQAQAQTGTEIAANRFAQGQLGTGTTAQPGSLLYNEQVQPKAVGAGATGAGQIDETAVSKLNKSGREAALYNLKAKGVVLPPNASAADIAAAANRVADAQVAAQSVQGADLQKPVSLATSAFQTAASEPAIRQKVYGDIFGGALDYTGKKIANRAGALGVQGSEQAQDQVGQLRSEGYNATPSNVEKILENKSNIAWLRNTLHSVKEMSNQVKQGQKLDPDTFNNTLNTWLNAPQTAESISTESGREKFLSGLRPVKSLGAVINEAHDIKDVVRALTAQNLGAQDQGVVLNQLDQMLSEQLRSGQAVSKDKQYRSKLKASAFTAPVQPNPNAQLGSEANPYPEGKEPPVGAYYLFKGVLHQRKK